MEKMLGSMMQGFFNSLSDEDKQKMMACFEKMKGMCPCTNMKEMSEDDLKVMMDKMKSFCGSKSAPLRDQGR